MAGPVLVEPNLSKAPPDLHQSSDEDLVRHLQDGVDTAWSVLYRRYYGQVLRVASRILRNHEEAEDATQIVFWDVFRAFLLYDARRGSFRAWLLQYAFHRSLNHKKSLQSRGFYQQCALDEIDSRLLKETLQRSPSHLLPDEAAQAVHQAMDHLTEPQRATLKMIFLEGLTLADVAQRLKQREGNVRHHYYRGMRKLRDILLKR